MYGYVYLTTNLINGKKYIGQHKSDCFDSHYIGSGTHLKNAIKKYGRKNFLCEVLAVCESKEELDRQEIFWIAKFDAVNSRVFYNIAHGGNEVGTVSDSTKQKIRNAHTGTHHSDETKRKISQGNTGVSRKHIGTKGWHHSEETKQRLSQKNRNQVPWNKGKKTKPLSEETRAKISEALKRRNEIKRNSV